MSLIRSVDMKDFSSGNELENAMKLHFNMINTDSYFPIKEVEEILFRQKKYELWRMEKENRFRTPKGLIKFTPSSASKAKRDLFYKALGVPEDEAITSPYNNRWTRNSTAVHEAVQRDLLYAPYILDKPLFTVQMVEKEGFGLLPAWEKNIETYKIIEHKGKKFVVSGMMDGLLTYEKTGQTVGFEFKTKTNDAWQVHNMQKPNPSHVQQCVAYSLIFETREGEPLNDYLITYEAVPKDKWLAGASALNDIKAFHIHVTQRQKTNLLNKFAEVVDYVENGELPPIEKSKIMFSAYKSRYEDELRGI
jgi:hypothetical protein